MQVWWEDKIKACERGKTINDNRDDDARQRNGSGISNKVRASLEGMEVEIAESFSTSVLSPEGLIESLCRASLEPCRRMRTGVEVSRRLKWRMTRSQVCTCHPTCVDHHKRNMWYSNLQIQEVNHSFSWKKCLGPGQCKVEGETGVSSPACTYHNRSGSKEGVGIIDKWTSLARSEWWKRRGGEDVSSGLTLEKEDTRLNV